MGAAINFDANTVEPTTPFEPVPNDTYRAHIIASEVKPTKERTGQYLQLEWEILDGPYKGRKLWDRLNIVNQNATAQQIAQSALSAICHAAGVLRVSNSAQLHHIPMMIKVVIKQDKGYDPRNEIKSYKSANAQALAAGAPPIVPDAAAPAGARPDAPPWAQARKPA